MDDLDGKVAVVTGGASGIGLAFANRFAVAGMSLVVADIETDALAAATAALKSAGADVLGVHCDVSDAESVTALAAAVNAAYGTAHVVCLNAGVAHNAPIVEQSLADWEWVLGVNLMGIVHGLDSFLSTLIAQDEGHLVITASVAGHTAYPGLSSYSVSKHGAAAIAETLHNELSASGSMVGVTALCPGLVNTRIVDSDRNRPEHLTNLLAEPPTSEQQEMKAAAREFLVTEALNPAAVADLVHDAILSNTFWLFTDDLYDEPISNRHDEIRRRQNPSLIAGLIEEAIDKDS